MPTHVALFRGINVSGKNKLPMAGLRSLLASLGCADVRTCIQSGNAVFASKSRSRPALTKRILDAVEDGFGFRPKLLLLTAAERVAARDKNPFPQAAATPKHLHDVFLASEPARPDLDAINALATPTESCKLIGRVCYLHTPDGFGRSRLAAGVECRLGVDATARNHATVEKLVEWATVS